MKQIKAKNILIWCSLTVLVLSQCKLFEPYSLELSDSDKEFLVFEIGDHFELKSETTDENLVFVVGSIFYDTIIDGDIVTETVQGYMETVTLSAHSDSCYSEGDSCNDFEQCYYSIRLVKRQQRLDILFKLVLYHTGSHSYYNSGNQILNNDFNIQLIVLNDKTYDDVYVFDSNLNTQSSDNAIKVYYSKALGIIKIERLTSGELLFSIID